MLLQRSCKGFTPFSHIVRHLLEGKAGTDLQCHPFPMCGSHLVEPQAVAQPAGCPMDNEAPHEIHPVHCSGASCYAHRCTEALRQPECLGPKGARNLFCTREQHASYLQPSQQLLHNKIACSQNQGALCSGRDCAALPSRSREVPFAMAMKTTSCSWQTARLPKQKNT